MITKWQIWINDCLADGGGYLEDTCDDIVANCMATITEVNSYLVSIGQDEMYK